MTEPDDDDRPYVMLKDRVERFETRATAFIAWVLGCGLSVYLLNLAWAVPLLLAGAAIGACAALGNSGLAHALRLPGLIIYFVAWVALAWR